MTWNPCGHLVAYGSRPYTTMARPFRNSDKLVKIVWYRVDEDAPVLPFASALNSLDDQEERLWYEDQWHNEDPLASRNYNGKGPYPLPPDGHLCGSEQDFQEGGLYNPADVPPAVDLNGIPLCCSQVIVPQGGGVGGGVLTPLPPPVVPGVDCLTATELPLGVPVDFISDGRPGFYWFVAGVSGVGAFHFHGPILAFPTFRSQIGGVCPDFLGVIAEASSGPTCSGYLNAFAGTGPFLTLLLSVPSGTPFTLTMSAGAC